MLDTVKVPKEIAPMFEKAQEYVNRYFEQRHSDATKGTIEVAGQRYILIRADSMSVEFFETFKNIYKDVGEEQATTVVRQLLFDIAHAIGIQDARNFHHRMGVEDSVDRLSAGPIHFAYTGWAFVEILPESRPSPDENYYLIYDHPYSFESDSWAKAGKKSTFPVCIMNAGYSSGWCEESFGMPLVASEIMCKTRGDATCRFIMAPPHRIEQRIEDYLRKQTIPLGKVTYEIPGFLVRKQIEEDLRREKERTQHYLDIAGVMLVALDRDGKVTLINKKGCEVLGWDEKSILGKNWFENYLPEYERRAAKNVFQKIMCGKEEFAKKYENHVLTREGKILTLAWHNSLLLDPNGTPVGTLSSGEDITDRKKAEEALRLSHEQLFKSQKLEAIGRLAGGIAHDFNNLLTAIGGCAGLLLEDLEEGSSLRSNAEEITIATRKAANLTRQLLAYSRKQVLKPRVLDLNAVIMGMEKLFRRTVPESIKLITTLKYPVGMVKADESKIEQVLLNLVVNARDAVVDHGMIYIETDNEDHDDPISMPGFTIPAGRYVTITVRDTGQGIDQNTQQLVFEPFFTTKEPGMGSGLGLSMVFGIIKQSDGFVILTSEPGKGAAFKIHLPRVMEELEETAEKESPRSDVKGDETVLLVEDEGAVRSVVRRMLQTFGYFVLEAPDAASALQISSRYTEKIHILVTDVIMPNMNGRELADRLLIMRPDLKVLFISGYSDKIIAQHRLLDPDIHFLEKPFSPKVLVTKVREALEDYQPVE